MKKLLTLTVLGIVFGLTSISFAQVRVNALGVQLPIETRKVANQVQGEYSSVHENATHNIFGVQLPLDQIDSSDPNTSKDDYAFKDSNEKYIIVFGVKIPYRVS